MRNMVNCLLLSLLIGKVWAALLTISHTFRSKCLDAGMESYIVQLVDFDRVSHSGLLFKLKYTGVDDSVLTFVQSSSPTVGKESWLMMLRVSGYQ